MDPNGCNSARFSGRNNASNANTTPGRPDNSCEEGGIPEFVGGAETHLILTADETNIDPVRQTPTSSLAGESSWVWNVPSLPKVPAHIPLERGSLRIGKESQSTITHRISDFMRLNSITCSYHTEEARVDCMTESCLKFVVQLWRDGDDVIVEVQRRRGCGVYMQRLRRCFYKSITGEVQYYSVCQNSSRRRPSCALQKCTFPLKQVDEEDAKRKLRDARIQCLELMESTKKDENRLGMESLLVLTDHSKPCGIYADEMARALIYNEGALAKRLRHAFLSSLQRRWDECDWTEADCGITDDASCLEFSTEKSELCHEHLLALKVLVNCLDQVACDERDYLSNDAIMIHLCSPFWTEILNVLVVNLQESSQRPQEAALSAKCIRILECLGPDVVTPFVQNIVAPLLLPAYEFGKAHHLALQHESAELLHTIKASP